MESKRIKTQLKHIDENSLIKMKSMLLNSLPYSEYNRGKLSQDEQSMLEEVLKRHYEIYVSSFLGTDSSKQKQEEYYFYSLLKEVERKYGLYVDNYRNQGFKYYEIPQNYHGIPQVLFMYINELEYKEYQDYLTLLYLLIYDDKKYQFEVLDAFSMNMLVVMIIKEIERRMNKGSQKVKV